MRATTWAIVLVVLGALLAPSAAAGSTAGQPERVQPPSDLEVEQQGRSITLVWAPVADPRVAYYEVSLLDDDSRRREYRVEVGPEPRLTLDGLPIWQGQRWWVSARQDHLVGSEPVQGESFAPMAAVELDETGTIHETEGTDYSQGEERQVWFSLDHSMPVDVWVQPYIVEQVTVGDDVSDDSVQVDQQFPTAAGDRVTIKAGQTRGYFVIRHWPDQWRRYVRSRTVLGLRSSTPGYDHDGRAVGAVDVDQVGLVHVLHEDDQYRWPEVLSAESRARSGRVARVPVRLRTPARRDTTLHFKTVSRSARAGRDFRRTNGTVVVGRDKQTAWVRVPLLNRRTGRSRQFAVRIVRAERELAKVTAQSRTIVRITR